MNASHRGRGITRRAATTVANWALPEDGLHRLELKHKANNPASGFVARAAGFVQEGFEREKFLVAGDHIDVFTYEGNPPIIVAHSMNHTNLEYCEPAEVLAAE